MTPSAHASNRRVVTGAVSVPPFASFLVMVAYSTINFVASRCKPVCVEICVNLLGFWQIPDSDAPSEPIAESQIYWRCVDISSRGVTGHVCVICDDHKQIIGGVNHFACVENQAPCVQRRLQNGQASTSQQCWFVEQQNHARNPKRSRQIPVMPLNAAAFARITLHLLSLRVLSFVECDAHERPPVLRRILHRRCRFSRSRWPIQKHVLAASRRLRTKSETNSGVQMYALSTGSLKRSNTSRLSRHPKRLSIPCRPRSC